MIERRSRLCRCAVAVAALVAACPTLALGQATTAPLGGVVLDSQTRQPLAGALVDLRQPQQPQRTAATDADGRFRFESVPVGSHALFVSIVGYALAKYDVAVPPQGAEVTVLMNNGTAYTETVTVQGGAGVFGPREPGVAGQQTLGSAELRQLGGMVLDDPLRAVQALSGVNASDDFYGELSVRGNGFRDLNYTLDGVPAKFLLHTLKLVQDGASVTMINGDVLGSASLLRGAYPQRFDQRLGAALAFTSAEGSRERTRYNLTASGTSASGTADGPLGDGSRGSWLVSARRSYLDVFLKQVLNDSNLAFGFSDVFSKLTYNLSPAHQVEASVLAGNSLYHKATDQLDDPHDLGRASHTGWMGTAAWRYIPSASATIIQRVFATGESYDNRNGLDAQVATGRGDDYGYRADLVFAPASGRIVEAGGSIERLGSRQQQVFQVPGWPILGGEDFNAHANKVGAYGQLRWTTGPIIVTPGVRVDRFGLTGDVAASPWLQAEWPTTADTSLVFDAGLHHQFPEFVQVVGRRGDLDLRPSRATHVDAGFERRLGPAVRWLVTVYDREERDVPDLPDQYFRWADGVLLQQSATSHYQNRLDGSSRGVELMLQRKSPDGLSGWMTYSYSHTRYTDQVTGQRFDGDFDQRHTVTMFGRYRLSDRMSANARWRFGSNRPIAGYYDRHADGELFVGTQRNAIRVPAYSRLDVRFDRTYPWGSRRLTLFAEVANALDRDNLRQVPPSVDRISGQAFGLLHSMFPIVPSVGATLEF